jgi:hypothetical protein
MAMAVVRSRRRPWATVCSMRLWSFMIFDSSAGETVRLSDMTQLLVVRLRTGAFGRDGWMDT